MADSIALGQLQQDLEDLAIILKQKYSVLQKRTSAVTPLVDKRDEVLMPSLTEERKPCVSEEKPFKKIKITNEKTYKSSSARAKNKRSAKTDFTISEKTSEIPKTQKNDSFNRFWSYMDIYCADITMEDIKMLEKWMSHHENDSEYQTIPPLGIHYSVKWMEDDLLDELKEGSKAVENPKGISCDSIVNKPWNELLKTVEEENITSDDAEQPPLVKNLISSLVRENFMTSPSEIMTESLPEEPHLTEKAAVGESKSYSNIFRDSLENRLRAQLGELGILESDLNETNDDELLLELKRLQALLVPVSKYNFLKKERLLSRAKAEMAKQESQKRIHEANAKVMESFRTMLAARKKEGKKITKKELNQIRNVLEEREKLLKSSRIVNSFEMCSEK